MHLVMFDIDGTLVDSAGFDTELYVEAVREVLDVEIDSDWNKYEHVSDSGILDEVLRAVRLDGEHADARRARPAAFHRSRPRLRCSERPARSARSPARSASSSGCSRLQNVRVGVATGGWQPTAQLKLAQVGIGVERLGFASSSDALARTDIMQLAADRAMQGRAYERATYFGDGAWDRRASAALGYDFIAVGKAVQHDVAYADLRETDAILAQLGVS